MNQYCTKACLYKCIMLVHPRLYSELRIRSALQIMNQLVLSTAVEK